jgi:hypothetical protein
MSRNPRRGGALAGIILIMLIVGLVGFAALVSTGLYVADRVRISDSDSRGETTLETPFGSIRVHEHNNLDPQRMGVPIYPGAVRERDSRQLANFRFDFGDVHRAFSVAAAQYRTSDSIERVTDFYRDELPHWMISQKENGRTQLSFTKHGYKRLIAIHEQDGQTRIGLAYIGEPESN